MAGYAQTGTPQASRRGLRLTIASLLLTVALCVSAFGAASAGAAFAGGDGSAASPYQVETAEQLDLVREHLDKHFVLTADIDLSAYGNWTPIGSFQPRSDAPEDVEVPDAQLAFSGSFDGAGHTISNLTIDAPQSFAVGLFGCVLGTDASPGAVQNLTVAHADVTGGYLVGGIVGLQYQHCLLDSLTLSGTNTIQGLQGVGGIVGTGYEMTMRDCTATADIIVLGDDGACAGIVAGGTTFGALENCVAAGGSITAEGVNAWGLGGVCGAPYAAAEIIGCRAENVAIHAPGMNSRLIGGLLGFAGAYEGAAIIEGCGVQAVSITVSEHATAVGGLIGGCKEESEDSDTPSVFAVNACTVSGAIAGGARSGSLVGRATRASTVENCSGAMDGALADIGEVME